MTALNMAPWTTTEPRNGKRFVQTQTAATGIGYALIYLAMVCAYSNRKPCVAPGVVNSMVVSLMATPFVMLSVLVGVDCAVKGNCNLFAWIVAYFFLVMGTLTLMIVFSKK